MVRRVWQCCWEPGYAARYEEQWFRNLNVATRQRYKEQDLARAEAHRQTLLATTSDGRKAAEAGYVALCIEQANANLSSAPIGRAHNPAADVRQAMGVTATERKPRHEDPEALRWGRIELGLEELDEQQQLDELDDPGTPP